MIVLCNSLTIQTKPEQLFKRLELMPQEYCLWHSDHVACRRKKLITHGANTIYSSHASKPFGVAELVKTMKRYGLD